MLALSAAPDRRRPRVRAGIITAAATRCSPTRATVVAASAPARSGGTSEIAVSDTAVHTNRSAGRALQRSSAAAMTTPTTEKKPVTTAMPGQRDRLAAVGDLEVDADGPGERGGEGGGHHRRERGEEAGAGEPGAAGRPSPGGDDPVPTSLMPSPVRGRRSGSPSRGNWSSWKVTISVIAPPVMRRTSIVSGR